MPHQVKHLQRSADRSGFACCCAVWCRLCTSVAAPNVQLVTHLCYSDFNDIMDAVDNMDGVWGPQAADASLHRMSCMSCSCKFYSPSDVLHVRRPVCPITVHAPPAVMR